MRTSLLLLSLLAFCLQARGASPHATVQKVIGKASAPLHATLPPGAAFTTGAHSKSELGLAQGVARVGEQTAIETSPRGLVLQRGLTLVASNPGHLRKTIEVKAPGYRLQVKGTVQMAYDPGHTLKLVVLEGTATVALDSLMGEFETLQPGQLLVINPSDHRLPEPVEIDVQRLAATSALIGGGLGPLLTSGNINNATVTQAAGYARGDLQGTSLLLRGLSNDLEIENRLLATASKAARPTVQNAVQSERSAFNITDDLQNPHAVTPQQTYQFPDKRNVADTVSNTVLRRNSQNISRTHILEVTMFPLFDKTDPDNPIGIREPQLSGHVTVDPSFFDTDPKTLLFTTRVSGNGHDKLQVLKGANIFSPEGANLRFQVILGMDVQGATLKAGAAETEWLEVNAANKGLTIEGGSHLEGGRVFLHGGDSPADIVIAEKSKITAQHRIDIGQATSGTGITIRDSSQLKSIAGQVVLLTNRAGIQLNGAIIQAVAGNIAVDAVGPQTDGSTPGKISLSDAHLSAASVLRLRGYSAGGDALLIDQSMLKAGQLIELLAEGASTLRFSGKVYLLAPETILAGHTVEVDPKGNVHISGKARIYTDPGHDNYNKTGYGTITAKYGGTKAHDYGDLKH